MTETIARSIGLLSVIVCMALTMLMNWEYGWSQGSTAHERRLLAFGAAGVDLAKVVAVWFLFHHVREQRWLNATLAGVAAAFLVPVALMAAIGFVAQTRGTVIGSREGVAAAYQDVQLELAETETRRAAITTVRTPQQVDAAITAELRAPVMEGTRLRGSVDGVTGGCSKTDARALDACRRVAELRQELVDANEATRLDDERTRLRAEIKRLRVEGGMQDTNAPASAVVRLLGGALDVSQVMLGQSVLLPLAFEIWATFGMIVVFGDRRRAISPDAVTVGDNQTNSAATLPSAREPAVAAAGDTLKREEPAVANGVPQVDDGRRQAAASVEATGIPERFLAERLRPDASKALRREALYARYLRWCNNNNWAAIDEGEFTRAVDAAVIVGGWEWREHDGVTYLAGMKWAA